jgi:hypothetical protein
MPAEDAGCAILLNFEAISLEQNHGKKPCSSGSPQIDCVAETLPG